MAKLFLNSCVQPAMQNVVNCKEKSLNDWSRFLNWLRIEETSCLYFSSLHNHHIPVSLLRHVRWCWPRTHHVSVWTLHGSTWKTTSTEQRGQWGQYFCCVVFVHAVFFVQCSFLKSLMNGGSVFISSCPTMVMGLCGVYVYLIMQILASYINWCSCVYPFRIIL